MIVPWAFLRALLCDLDLFSLQTDERIALRMLQKRRKSKEMLCVLSQTHRVSASFFAW